MAKFYVRGDRVFVRAQQIWMILTAQAQLRPGETLTYGDLAKAMGFDPKAGHTLARHLGTIAHLCREHGLPPLHSIVVQKDPNVPNDGIPLDGKKHPKALREVFDFDWFSLRPPSTGTLRRVYEEYYAPSV